MSKFESLIKSLNSYIHKSDSSVIDNVEDFPGIEEVPQLVAAFEKEIAKLLRAQKKYYVNALDDFVSKSDTLTLEQFLRYMEDTLFPNDAFRITFSKETLRFLDVTVGVLASHMMTAIDREVAFNVMSQSSIDWLQNWSEELASIMQLNTHQALESALSKVITDGGSIADAELAIKDLPQFNRNRARTTARTEILTASSRAHYESFLQSPSVIGKKWKHSGTKANKPRESHQALDGVIVDVEEHFLVDGELGLYPRDTNFSARNRVHCGCVIGPVVDNDILRLSPEEKEQLRKEALEEINNGG